MFISIAETFYKMRNHYELFYSKIEPIKAITTLLVSKSIVLHYITIELFIYQQRNDESTEIT